jgi:hypothetical protein
MAFNMDGEIELPAKREVVWKMLKRSGSLARVYSWMRGVVGNRGSLLSRRSR